MRIQETKIGCVRNVNNTNFVSEWKIYKSFLLLICFIIREYRYSSLYEIILDLQLYYLIFRIKSLFIVDLIGRKLLHLHKESPPSFQHPNFCQVTHLLMNEQERVSPNFFKSAVSSHYLHPKYILNTQVLSNLSRWMDMKCQKKLINFI